MYVVCVFVFVFVCCLLRFLLIFELTPQILFSPLDVRDEYCVSRRSMLGFSTPTTSFHDQSDGCCQLARGGGREAQDFTPSFVIDCTLD